MEILQIVQKSFAIKLIFSLFVSGFTLSTLFVCKDANTFFEYSSSMYITATMALITFNYAIVILSMSKLFGLISECLEIYEQSESTS